MSGKWIVGEYSWYKGSWTFCDPMLDFPGGWLDASIDEIDERRIEREASATEKNARYDIAPPKLGSCIVKGCKNPQEVAAFLCNEHLQEYLNDVSPIKEK